MWSGVAEHRRPAVRHLVRAHALEDARAVVQRMREHVDLGVLVRDELAVHPDLMAHVTAPPAPPWSRRRWSRCRPGPRGGRPSPGPCRPPILRQPPASSRPSPWRSMSAADRIIPSGLAIPWPAMSGAVPWTGSNRPGPTPPKDGGRQHAQRAGEHRRLVGQDVAEHVLGDDHLEVARGGDQPHRGGVDEQVLELDVRELLGVDAGDDGAPQPATCRARWPCRRTSRGDFAASNAVRAIRSISSTV